MNKYDISIDRESSKLNNSKPDCRKNKVEMKIVVEKEKELGIENN